MMIKYPGKFKSWLSPILPVQISYLCLDLSDREGKTECVYMNLAGEAREEQKEWFIMHGL